MKKSFQATVLAFKTGNKANLCDTEVFRDYLVNSVTFSKKNVFRCGLEHLTFWTIFGKNDVSNAEDL